MNSYQKKYSILFITSLMLFLVNYLIQGQFLFAYSDTLGIIFKMGPIFWAGFITLLALICFHYANFKSIDSKYVYLTLILAIIYLIATPVLYEKLPRFEDTWGHSFLAQQIFETKKVENGISIYEQYPGSILFYGLLYKLMPSYLAMKFFPPLFFVFGILVVYSLFKNQLGGKTAFLISILYMLFNWTVEDNHISPQFLILNMYFLFMYIAIRLMDGKKDRTKYFLALTLLGAAIVFSHPFTPLFLLFILGSVFLFCTKFRSSVIPIAVMLLIIFTVYEGYRTSTFSTIIQYARSFIDILRYGPKFETATSRLGTTLLSRQIFLASRVVITVISIAMGAIGILAMRMDKYKTEANFFLGWAFSLIPLIIFLALVLKGEFYERFALISSLPLSALAAYSFSKFKVGIKTIFILLLILSPLYFIAKYGNESFESISEEKLKVNCFSTEFNSNCEENSRIADNYLLFQLDSFGKSHFTTSTEDIMASSVFNSKSIDSVTNSINMQIEKLKLDRIYSTNTAAVYRY